jgi:polyhydroxybutyrate depolymerase
MKKLFFLTLILPFFAQLQSNLSKTIVVNGQTRAYKIYIPAIYDGSQAVPLVFNFHGYTSSNTAQESYGNFKPIADTANFILVHPQGLDIGGGAGWNSFSNTDASNYDYQFVEQMIDQISTDYTINPNRIYSTGMSNGGFFSYDMACFMSHHFAAIASVTGSMIATHLNACNPGRPIPVMQIHGTSDPTVSYNGSGGIITSVAIEQLVDFWVNQNNCTTPASYTALPNINSADGCTAEHFVYEHPSGLGTVEFYKITGGLHTWPGTVFTSVGTNQDFSASKEIWRFFSQHERPDLNANLQELEKTIAVYPNPSSSIVNIELNDKNIHEISLINQLGEVLLNKKVSEKLSIDLSAFSSGIYFIQAGTFTQKVVKD